MEEFKSTLNKNEFGKTLTPIKEVSAKNLNLTLTPKEDIEKVFITMTNAANSILGYNPQRFYSISKDMLIDNIAFDTHSYMTRVQKIVVPLEDRFVEQLIACDKVLAKIQHVHKKEADNTLTDEIRMLLIGKLNGEYIPFQLNFKRETIGVNGKKKSILKSSLGVVLGGKNFVNLERYDPNSNHQNLFYDGSRHYTEQRQCRLLMSTAHLHYTNKRATVSLFNILQNEGYSSDEILQSQIMGKQEAVPFQTFNNCDEAKNFFFKRYNVKMDFKRMPQKFEKAGPYFELITEICKKKEEAKLQAIGKEQTKKKSQKNIKDQKPILKHRRIYVESAEESKISDREIDLELEREFGPDEREFDLETMPVSYKHSTPQAKKNKNSIFHYETSEEAQKNDEEINFELRNESYYNSQKVKNAYTGSNNINMAQYNKKMKQKQRREARKNDGRNY